jgi:hypothetical protein
MRSDLDTLSNLESLDGYAASPWMSVLLLVVSLLIGAGLLMLVVRWSEGFAMNFLAALKITALTLVAATVLQFAVFGALVMVGVATMSAYWIAMLIVLLLSCVAFVFIYAYGIKQPNGEVIGMARAIKVTLIQLGLSVAVIVVLSFAVAILIVSGVVDIPLVLPE